MYNPTLKQQPLSILFCLYFSGATHPHLFNVLSTCKKPVVSNLMRFEFQYVRNAESKFKYYFCTCTSPWTDNLQVTGVNQPQQLPECIILFLWFIDKTLWMIQSWWISLASESAEMWPMLLSVQQSKFIPSNYTSSFYTHSFQCCGLFHSCGHDYLDDQCKYLKFIRSLCKERIY